MNKFLGSVLGFGNVGQKMTEFINKRDDAEIVIACNRGKEKLELARHKYNLKTTHDAKEAVDAGKDFTVITSSNAAHMNHVKLAVEAKRRIFLEKPIAVTLSEAEEMADIVDKSGVLNVVNYSFRYIPAYILLKKKIEEGVFGRILSAWNIRLRDFGLYSAGARHSAIIYPEESGGWTVHHLCHGIDLLYWWLGPMKTVFAGMNDSMGGKENISEETVTGTIIFENGAVGTVTDSVCKMREHHTGIIGTKATAVLNGENEETVLKISYEGTDQVEYIKTVDCKPEGVGMGHFLDCLIKGEKSRATVRDSIPSLKAALSMQQSARTGRAVNID